MIAGGRGEESRGSAGECKVPWQIWIDRNVSSDKYISLSIHYHIASRNLSAPDSTKRGAAYITYMGRQVWSEAGWPPRLGSICSTVQYYKAYSRMYSTCTVQHQPHWAVLYWPSILD